ncbi:MAG TPA: hypothetical protein VGQ84_00675 [Gaiellaceae bacterium]|nr:hypothetical protein [Gaiellaceae bacterium]
MDELALLRDFRGKVGSCDAIAEARARSHLRAGIAAEAEQSSLPKRRRRPRRRLILLTALGTLAFVVGTPTFGVGSRLHDLLFQVSTPSEPITTTESLSPESKWLLEHEGEVDWDSFTRIGAAGPIVYYEIRKQSGERCFGSGRVAMRPEVQSLYCPASGRSFAYPSASQPIVDFSSFVLDARTDASRLSVLTGIAADGVARVGVVGTEGAIHSVAVRENAYYAKEFTQRIRGRARRSRRRRPSRLQPFAPALKGGRPAPFIWSIRWVLFAGFERPSGGMWPAKRAYLGSNPKNIPPTFGSHTCCAPMDLAFWLAADAASPLLRPPA